MKPIKTIPYNPLLTGLAESTPDIVFSREGGQDVTLRILKPWKNDLNKDKRYPLIVFIQGSGWTSPNIGYHLPHIGQFAMAGYVVATVTHRSCNDGHPAPAFLRDVKAAIRYLRAHAEEHQIDPARVAAWGTSSGGNTALLVGTTGDDPAYKTAEYAEQSDAVSAAVSCFGPTDVEALFKFLIDMPGAREIGAALAGSMDEDRIWAAAREMSPVNHVQPGRTYPPMLLLNGTADPIVPHAQMEAMVEKLEAVGSTVEAYYVDNAEHEGNFWSPEVRDVIMGFVKKYS
jgi:acetyl esterase/lipase